MKEEIKKIEMESKEEAKNNWDVTSPRWYPTQAMRRIIHRNKSFLRKGGLLMIEVNWEIIFDRRFFTGYRFRLEQKLSSEKPMKIRVKFCPEDCIQKIESR